MTKRWWQHRRRSNSEAAVVLLHLACSSSVGTRATPRVVIRTAWRKTFAFRVSSTRLIILLQTRMRSRHQRRRRIIPVQWTPRWSGSCLPFSGKSWRSLLSVVFVRPSPSPSCMRRPTQATRAWCAQPEARGVSCVTLRRCLLKRPRQGGITFCA